MIGTLAGHRTGLFLCPQEQQAPPSPAGPLDSPRAARALQSFLWKSVQALVLQYLLQVRIDPHESQALHPHPL